MALSQAPFFAELADGPEGGAAYWCTAEDGVRLRVGYWPCEDARGTVLLFPGRTEFVEKYGRTAGEFAEHGYATLAIDWRGQGMADRLIEDRRVGHVIKFTDYQRDVRAALEVAEELGAPKGWHLLGHSMGGAIGMRAALEGLPVETCSFTGPMWGIYMSTLVRPFGWALPRMANLVGMGTRLPPSTRYESYVLVNQFEDNVLTRDLETYEFMRNQLVDKPELALGGPSMIWLREGLEECKYLARQPSPDLPCLTFIGDNERIIDTAAVHDRMRRWPNGTLDVVPNAEHEVLMERPETRKRIMEMLQAHFDGDFDHGQNKAHCA